MANYNYVMPYEGWMEADLEEKGYAHPKVGPGNRFPTKQEVFDAISGSGALEVSDAEEYEFFAQLKGTGRGGAYKIRIGCADWDRLGQADTDSITMHGEFDTEVALLESLSHQCGQLVLYPDTGCPAVIIEPGLDVERICRLWHESVNEDDSWDYFYRNAGY